MQQGSPKRSSIISQLADNTPTYLAEIGMAALHSSGAHMHSAYTNRACVCCMDARRSWMAAWYYTVGKVSSGLSCEHQAWTEVCSETPSTTKTEYPGQLHINILLQCPAKVAHNNYCGLLSFVECHTTRCLLSSSCSCPQLPRVMLVAWCGSWKHLGPDCELLSHTDEESLVQMALLECESLNKWIIYHCCLLKLKSLSQFCCYFHHLHILSPCWWEPIWLIDRVSGKCGDLQGLTRSKEQSLMSKAIILKPLCLNLLPHIRKSFLGIYWYDAACIKVTLVCLLAVWNADQKTCDPSCQSIRWNCALRCPSLSLFP